MNGKLRSRNILLYFVLLVGFVLFLAMGVMFSISRQRTMLLRQETVHMQHELALLEKIIEEELVEGEYASLGRFLTLFAADRTNIASIRVRSSEGKVLAVGQRSVPAGFEKVYSQRIPYGDGRYVDLEVVEDLRSFVQTVDYITKQYIFWSVIFAVLMGLGLWYVFRKTLLRPMALTIEETSRINTVLEQSVKERTMEWMKANTELQMEIQERMAVEKLIRESENKYKHLVELTTDFIYVWDNHGIQVYMNDGSFRILGYAPEEIIGKPSTVLIHPEDRGTSSEMFKSMMEQHIDIFNFENRYQAKDGTVLNLLHNIRVLRDDVGEIAGVQGIARDITKRKKTEEELRRNFELQSVFNELLRISLDELSLNDILQHALDIIVSVSWLSLEAKGSIHLVEDEPEMLILRASKGLSVHLQEKCSRLPFGRCICGRAALTQSIQHADCIDDRHDITYEGMEPHGHYCVPFFYSGKVSGVMNLYINKGHQRNERECRFLKAYANVLAGIVQRKRAEEERSMLILKLQDAFEAVTRSQKKWMGTFDSITDLIFITDVNYMILRANRAFAEHFQLTVKQVFHKKCYELFSMTELIYSECPHATSLREQRVVQGEFVDQTRGRTFMMTASPYFSQDNELVGSIISCKDVTEEKEREMRLIMSERLASLGQMALGIAHEINNPLAAIAGCTEGLLKRVEQERFDPELFKSYLNIIGEEILRCKNITTGMLSFVRKTTYDKQSVDIHKTLDKALEIIGFQGRLKEVEIIRNYKEGMLQIQGSGGELRQVFLAIITNALDVMEDKGGITIETGVEGKKIFVRITDAGPGIPHEHITRIFEPFFTTKGEKGGTGLGLAIANKIITNHRGSIEVFSELRKGTAFTITLPL